MKNRKYFVIFIIATIIFLLSAAFSITYFANSDNIMLDNISNYQIKKYVVTLDVHENGLVDVQEDIIVDFTSDNALFIKKIVKKSDYTNKDGNIFQKTTSVSNLKVLGNDKYKILEDNYGVFVSFEETSTNDLVGYKLKYTYDLGNNTFDNYDEFIYHAFDGFLDSQIRKAEITINMPFDVSNYKINFYKDKYRNGLINEKVYYKINNNVISIHYNDNKGVLNSALTIDMVLPIHSFKNNLNNYSISLVMIGIILLLLLINILLLFKKGKKNNILYLDKVEPSSIAYLLNKKIVNKKVISTILLQLIGKKYIRVSLNNLSKKIEVHNLIWKPDPPIKPSMVTSKRIIVVKRMHEIDNTLSEEDRRIMKKYFGNEYIVSIEKDIGEFLEKKDHLLQLGYIAIINDNIEEIENINKSLSSEYQKQLAIYNEKMDKYEKKLLSYQEKIGNVVTKTSTEKYLYRMLMSNNKVLVLEKFDKFDLVIRELNNLLSRLFANKISLIKDYSKKLRISLTIYISILLWFVAYFIVSDMSYQFYFLYYISLIGIVINILLLLFSTSKIKYSELIDNQVKIFKRDYIEKINNGINENNFYSYFALAYALNIADRFVANYKDVVHFHDIAMFLNDNVEKNIRIKTK